ncbi:MAG: 4Fe-4S binding protein [Spirochaetota bacterium]
MNTRASRVHSKKHPVQTVSQMLFLVVFAGLTVSGRIQLWLGIFILVGVLGSMIWGRIYCSAVCPMATLMRAERWLYKTLNIKRAKTPSWAKKRSVRIVFFVLYFGSMILLQQQGVDFPLLPAAVVLAVVLTLFFEESFWHRRICPFGTLLSLTSRASRRSVHIDSNICTNCGACERVCNAECIHESGTVRTIEKNECIGCYACQKVCRPKAISYGKL